MDVLFMVPEKGIIHLMQKIQSCYIDEERNEGGCCKE